MGVNVFLQDEEGNIIDQKLDTDNILLNLLQDAEEDNYEFIEYIDLYGDTIFNRLQSNKLLEDFRKLRNNSGPKKFLNEMISIIEKSENRTHAYIKFEGD